VVWEGYYLPSHIQTRGVAHYYGLAILDFKYFKGERRRVMEIQIFHHVKKQSSKKAFL
jgi:hypothetical protein